MNITIKSFYDVTPIEITTLNWTANDMFKYCWLKLSSDKVSEEEYTYQHSTNNEEFYYAHFLSCGKRCLNQQEMW